jgi:diadenosine tetraphosphate (Ap4A) HIT family hydrolase
MIENCLGCQIAKKTIACPGGTIFETDNFVLNQDFDIPIESFFIIGSKKHIKSLIDLSEEELNELIILINKVRKNMKQLFEIEITYIFQDENAPHFHIWIFPQLNWMNMIGKGIQHIPSIIEYSKKYPAKKEGIIRRVNLLKEKLRI